MVNQRTDGQVSGEPETPSGLAILLNETSDMLSQRASQLAASVKAVLEKNVTEPTFEDHVLANQSVLMVGVAALLKMAALRETSE